MTGADFMDWMSMMESRKYWEEQMGWTWYMKPGWTNTKPWNWSSSIIFWQMNCDETWWNYAWWRCQSGEHQLCRIGSSLDLGGGFIPIGTESLKHISSRIRVKINQTCFETTWNDHFVGEYSTNPENWTSPKQKITEKITETNFHLGYG